jgi:hypothetical protein
MPRSRWDPSQKTKIDTKQQAQDHTQVNISETQKESKDDKHLQYSEFPQAPFSQVKISYESAAVIVS